MLSSPQPQHFQVFISHAGEDKATIAIPLRDMLQEKGISAFVDEKDMEPGADAKKEMISAMKTADIGVMVMSPEFIAREWPMKELLCFLKRREEVASDDPSHPVVIPVFYRLSISELYAEPQFNRKLPGGKGIYKALRFSERRDRGDPEADIDTIKKALRTLHGITGIRNDNNATNGSEYVMSERREALLEKTCNVIVSALKKKKGNRKEKTARDRYGTAYGYYRDHRKELLYRGGRILIGVISILGIGVAYKSMKLRAVDKRMILDALEKCTNSMAALEFPSCKQNRAILTAAFIIGITIGSGIASLISPYWSRCTAGNSTGKEEIIGETTGERQRKIEADDAASKGHTRRKRKWKQFLKNKNRLKCRRRCL